MHPHVLVWGVMEEVDPTAAHRHAEALIAKVFSFEPRRQKGAVRYAWMPFDWNDPPRTPSTTKWLWVAYAEIQVEW
jgi:hypothetical protein